MRLKAGSFLKSVCHLHFSLGPETVIMPEKQPGETRRKIMDQNQKEGADMASLFATWTQATTDFWANMTKMQPHWGASPDPSEPPKESESSKEKGPASKMQKNLEIGAKILQALISRLGEPENLDATMKGMDSVPEFTLKMTQQFWDGYLELQKKWAEQARKFGQHTEAYQFEDIEQNIFKTWNELYEEEFQKFFNVPSLGLTRFYQERLSQLADKFTVYQSSLSEFVYMFYVPIEKTTGVMQEKMEEMADQGELHDDFNTYYNMWVKILEGHYMTLLKSPEYLQVMNKTIIALTEYKEARNEVLYDILQKLPIPTNKDMDEVYKELYLLKKRFRDLSRVVDGELSEPSADKEDFDKKLDLLREEIRTLSKTVNASPSEASDDAE